MQDTNVVEKEATGVVWMEDDVLNMHFLESFLRLSDVVQACKNAHKVGIFWTAVSSCDDETTGNDGTTTVVMSISHEGHLVRYGPKGNFYSSDNLRPPVIVPATEHRVACQ